MYADLSRSAKEIRALEDFGNVEVSDGREQLCQRIAGAGSLFSMYVQLSPRQRGQAQIRPRRLLASWPAGPRRFLCLCSLHLAQPGRQREPRGEFKNWASWPYAMEGTDQVASLCLV
jgi:hypothetical protein